MRERDHRPAGLLEFLFAELRGAIADMRGKVVEEGWFGRPAARTNSLAKDWSGPGVHGASLPARQSFEEAWAPRPPGDAAREHEKGIDLER